MAGESEEIAVHCLNIYFECGADCAPSMNTKALDLLLLFLMISSIGLMIPRALET
jgi:hypothetical protein